MQHSSDITFGRGEQMLGLNFVLLENIEYGVIIIQWETLISSNIMHCEAKCSRTSYTFSIRNLTPANSLFEIDSYPLVHHMDVPTVSRTRKKFES